MHTLIQHVDLSFLVSTLTIFFFLKCVLTLFSIKSEINKFIDNEKQKQKIIDRYNTQRDRIESQYKTIQELKEQLSAFNKKQNNDVH